MYHCQETRAGSIIGTQEMPSHLKLDQGKKLGLKSEEAGMGSSRPDCQGVRACGDAWLLGGNIIIVKTIKMTNND